MRVSVFSYTMCNSTRIIWNRIEYCVQSFSVRHLEGRVTFIEVTRNYSFCLWCVFLFLVLMCVWNKYLQILNSKNIVEHLMRNGEGKLFQPVACIHWMRHHAGFPIGIRIYYTKFIRIRCFVFTVYAFIVYTRIIRTWTMDVINTHVRFVINLL